MYHSRGLWVPSKHLIILNSALVRVALGQIRRLIVTMPPRHGKSEFISKYFPAWFEGRYPWKKTVLTSYGAEFAEEWGGKARDVIEDIGAELFAVQLAKGASSRWTLKKWGGGMQTAGAGGSLTGKGAHLLVADDPIKNDEEANSPNHRQKIWDWFRATAFTRLEPGGCIIVVMTRWNEDDMVGRLVKQDQGTEREWTIINFPAICEDEDLPLEKELGRKNGEALWDERYDLDALKIIKGQIGTYWWTALYQQRPSPIEGNLFKRKWFLYFEIESAAIEGSEETEEWFVLHGTDEVKRVLKSECWSFSTVDLAASLRQMADYFVISTFYVTPDSDLLWVDCFRDKLEGPDQRKEIIKTFKKHKIDYMGIESVGYQLTLIQDLIRDGWNVTKLEADKDKISRSIPATVRYENGKVYHLLNAPWLGEAEHELVMFPEGAHDDIVDTMGYASREVSRHVGDLVVSL